MKTTQKEAMEAFDRWWFNEGSGMPPRKEEDHAEHVRRMCAIAWGNGAYCAGAID
jgi:hypothetical protein